MDIPQSSAVIRSHPQSQNPDCGSPLKGDFRSRLEGVRGRSTAEAGGGSTAEPDFRSRDRGKPTTAEATRAAIAATAPGLLEFMDAARDRLDPKLTHLETPTLAAGKRPWWWQVDWEEVGRGRP